MTALQEKIDAGIAEAEELAAIAGRLTGQVLQRRDLAEHTLARIEEAARSFGGAVESLGGAMDAAQEGAEEAVTAVERQLEALTAFSDDVDHRVQEIDESCTQAIQNFSTHVDQGWASLEQQVVLANMGLDRLHELARETETALAQQRQALGHALEESQQLVASAHDHVRQGHDALVQSAEAWEGELKAQISNLLQEFASAVARAESVLAEFETHVEQVVTGALSSSEQAYYVDAGEKLGNAAQSLLGAFGELGRVCGAGQQGVEHDGMGLVAAMDQVVGVIELLKPAVEVIEEVLG